MACSVYKKGVAASLFVLGFSAWGAGAQTLDELTSACLGKDPMTRLNACSVLLGDQRMVDTNPTNVYNNRGLAYTELGQSAEAIQDFNRAIEADPTNALAYSNRGLAYDRTDQSQRAVEDLSKAISLDAKNASFYNNRCYVLTKMGNAEEALSDCTKALQLEPDSSNYMDTSGYAHLRLGQYAQAISLYTSALKSSPGLAESLYGRGIARQRMGDTDGAADITAALAIDKDIGTQMQRLGIAPTNALIAAGPQTSDPAEPANQPPRR